MVVENARRFGQELIGPIHVTGHAIVISLRYDLVFLAKVTYYQILGKTCECKSKRL
jgi:hypothetical protein